MDRQAFACGEIGVSDVVRPFLPGVSSGEVFFHLGVARFPESGEVVGDLPGALVRGEDFGEDFDFALRDDGCFPDAE